MRNSGKNPRPVQKNKYLAATFYSCFYAVPVTPDKTDFSHTAEGEAWWNVF